MGKAKEDFDLWQSRRLLALAAELHLKSARRLPTEALREKIAGKLFWKGKGRPRCFGHLFDPDHAEYPRGKFFPCRVCEVKTGCEKRCAQRMERGLAREWKGTDPEYYKYRGKRRKRDSELARWLKRLYRHRCQICGFYIEDKEGRPLIHVHHIEPHHKVGRKGDRAKNMLVLCPNHHLQLDLLQPVRPVWSARAVRCKGKTIKLKALKRSHWLARIPSR